MLRLIHAFVAMIALAVPAAAGPNGITQAESWFYIERNVTKGPLYEAEVVRLAEDGVIRASTQVFEPGRGWTFAKNIPALQPYVGGTPSARPAPQRPQYDSGPLVEPAPQPVSPGYVPPPVSGAPIGQRPGYAAPSGDAGDELTRAIGNYLSGTWRTVTRNDYGGAVFEHSTDLNFRPDGSFDGTMTAVMLNAAGTPPSTEPVSGTWRITPLAADRFILAMDEPTGVPFDEVTLRIEGRSAMVSPDGSIRYDRIR